MIAYFYRYFSISILLRTLFDYWKKDEIDMTNLALDDRIRVMMMNLVSRFVGATVRSITILVGLSVIVFIFLAMIVSYIGFILLPIIVIFFIINGLARL